MIKKQFWNVCMSTFHHYNSLQFVTMTKNTRLFSNYPQLLILSILSITSFIKIVYTLEGFQAINHQQHSQDYDDLFKFYRSFKTSNNSRIVAQVGSSVELPCSLDDSSSDIVTWTRKNDYKLLTGGYLLNQSNRIFYWKTCNSSWHVDIQQRWTVSYWTCPTSRY